MESFSGCDPSCYFIVGAWKLSQHLDLNRSLRFSAWMKAPAGHEDFEIELFYETESERVYPGPSAYTGSGEWQRHEVRLGLRQIPDIEQVWAAVRHRGTTGAPAYIDDLQLVTDGPVATTYDVEVATDAGFTNVIQAWTDVNAPTAEDRQVTVEGLSRTTAYHWRVRGTNAGGTGSWTRGVFTTTDRAARRYYVKDHLGSIRAVVDPDAPGTGAEKVVETRDYYPFGLRMPGRSVTEGTPAVEDFTGYESDVETGFLYAGARYYMAALGRFGVTDRFADKEPTLSPYQYAGNRPVVAIDVNGDSIIVGMTPIATVNGKRFGAPSHTALIHVNEETGERTVIAEAKSERTISSISEEQGNSSGEVNGWGKLLRVDESSSYGREFRMDKEAITAENSVTVPRPEGMTDQEHADALSAAADTFEPGSKEYSPLPHLEPNTLIGGDAYGNSNAFVGSVIRAVGEEGFHPGDGVKASHPTAESNLFRGVAPGWTLDILE